MKDLEKIRRSMLCTRTFLYFIRNNPCFTQRYYYRFIEIVGSEKYLHSPIVKKEWDGARYSFDKMYGLVSAWSKSFEIFNSKDINAVELKQKLTGIFSRELTNLKKHCNTVESGIFELVKNSEENEGKRQFSAFIGLKERISELERTIDKEDSSVYILFEDIRNIEEIIGIYKDITVFANAEKNVTEKKLEEKELEEKKKQQEESEKAPKEKKDE